MGLQLLIKALGLPEGSTLEDVAEALKIGADASIADVVAAIVAALDAMADSESTEASDTEEEKASDTEDEEEKASDTEDEEEKASDTEDKMAASAVRRMVQRELEKSERRALLSAARSMGVKPAELSLLASASIKSVRAFVDARKASSTAKVRAPGETRKVKLNATEDDLREFARASRTDVASIRKMLGA